MIAWNLSHNLQIVGIRITRTRLSNLQGICREGKDRGGCSGIGIVLYGISRSHIAIRQTFGPAKILGAEGKGLTYVSLDIENVCSGEGNSSAKINNNG